jgi:arginase
VHCIIVASLARSIPSPLQIPSPNPESSIEIDRRRAERRGDMGGVAAGTRWIHHVRRLSAAKVSADALERGQSRVIDASLTLIRERAKLKAELLRALGGVKASACLLGVPLGHNSSFLQGPAFAPPRIREAIWCGSTNSSTEEGTVNVFKLYSSISCIQ